MGQKLQGLLIRKRRQEREWSQAALCNGICAVSYLSKIEQGKVESSPEVLDLLFRRLDIQWQDDPAFCREAAAWFEEYYDRLFSGEDLQDMTQELLSRETVYRNSPFFLDWLLLSWAATGQVQEEVEEFVSAMDARQQNLHLCLKGQFQDLLRIAERSYFFLQAGKHAYWRGDYSYAVACFFQGAERAAREGSLPVMMLCHLFLGNCYSTLNQLDQTLEHYEAARRMARSLGRRVTLVEIAYNQATTELQMGLTQEALRHLLEHPWNEALYFHKLAICYERLGQEKLARVAKETEDMEEWYRITLHRLIDICRMEAPLGDLPCDPPQAREIFEQMCGLVRFRLDHKGYLQEPEYGKALHSCVRSMEQQFSIGFVRFHVPWLEEWYAANRQYRQAYELVRKFS